MGPIDIIHNVHFLIIFPALKILLQHWDSVYSNISRVKSVIVFTVTLAGGASGFPALAQDASLELKEKLEDMESDSV